MLSSASGPPERSNITSPFSETRATPTIQKNRNGYRRTLWIVLVTCAAIFLVIAAVATTHYLNDPYRKLEPFPIARYFDDFQSLAGLKFRADLRVDADLGWKEGVGRLMIFTSSGENRRLAVFIPPKLSNVFFNKGQDYTIELEVKEGGLIYANSCQKN